jgi:hypothetical protein
METTKKVPRPPRFIAIADHYWGTGTTVDEARKRMKAEGARLNQKHLVYELPENVEKVYVNDFGSVCWNWTEGNVPATPEENRERSKMKVVFVRGKLELRDGTRIRVGDVR